MILHKAALTYSENLRGIEYQKSFDLYTVSYDPISNILENLNPLLIGSVHSVVHINGEEKVWKE